MVAWMDAEALAATLATGEVHFHSRSRDRLWRKGETSGNVLRLVDLAADCDGDALLVTVDPAGPTCHRGTRSCFDPDGRAGRARRPQGFAWLETLWATIASRAADRPTGSYTARLLDGGVDAAGRKVTEEATEVLLAAKDDAAAEAAGATGTDRGRPGRRDRRPALPRAGPARRARIVAAGRRSIDVARGDRHRPERDLPRHQVACGDRDPRPISRRRLPIRTLEPLARRSAPGRRRSASVDPRRR